MRGYLRIAMVALLVLGASLTQALAAMDGRMIYSVNTATPQVRTYASSTNTFAAATATLAGAIPTFIVNKRAPTRNENLVGYVTTGGVLYIYRWNGATWTNETSAAGGWGGTVTVGGDGVNGRRFDIAYEKTTGKAMVVYSANAAGANELRYRTWNGTAWSAAANLDSARLTGIPTAIKLLASPLAGSNEIALTVCNMGTATANTATLTTLIWSGAAWGNEPATAHSTAIPSAATTGLVQNDLFDQAYEGLSGHLMVVFSNAAAQCYRTYGAATWGAVVTTLNTRTPPLQMIAVGNPNSDQILVAYNRSASANIYAHVWDGATMPASTTVGITGNTAVAINKKEIAGGWVRSGATDAAIVVWSRPAGTLNTVDYNTFTTAWGTAASAAITRPGNYAWMDADTDADELMLTFSDANSDLFAKRCVFTAPATFTWTNTDAGAALTATLTNATTKNFGFCYDSDFTPPVEGTLSVTSPPVFGTFVGNPLTFQETFTEAESSVKSCEYTIDNGATWAAGVVSGAKPSFTCTASGADVSAATSVTLKMRATSQAGTSTPVNSATYTVDAMVPTTTDNYPGGASAVDVNVTLSATDGTGSGVASTKWCQDTLNTCVPATVGTGPIAVTGAAGAKTTAYLRYFSTDNVGNAETVKSETIIIDKRNLTETIAIQFPSVDVQTIVVNVLFGGDVNLNNSCALTWGTDGVTYGNTATATRSGNAYAATIGSLNPGVTYYFRAQFADADTVTGTNPLLANVTTPKVLLLHNSTSTGAKYGTWGTSFACDTCHIDSAPNIKRIRAAVGGVGLTNAATPTPEVITGRVLSNTGKAGGATAGWATTTATNAVCDVCHARTTVFKNGVADTVAGAILSNGTPPHPNDLDCVKCHKHRDGFKVNAGCTDCHAASLTWNTETYGAYQVGTVAPVIFAPNGALVRGEAYGGHLLALKTDSLAGLTTKAAWDAQCLKCHDGHVKNPDAGVHIPNNTDVGINYSRGYIALGGSATSGTTEAEICWNCHDLAANGVSEWGVNTDTNGTGNNYNFGTIYTSAAKTTQTSRWIGTYWTSANFSYKEGWLNNKPNTTSSVTGTANGGSTHAAAAGTQGIDAVSAIRCTYCHDVHNTAALTTGFLGAANDPNGKPYLRGRWVGSPYKEDGAPRQGQAGTYPAVDGAAPPLNPWGAVPRGSAAMGTVMGGYWIDQNSGDPIAATYTATQFGGLCDLCHGTTKNGTLTAAEIDALNTYGTAGAGWVSALNGHSNSVDEGTDTTTYIAARNIFAGRGGAATQNAQNTADHPYMLFQGTSMPGDASGGFRAGDSQWRYTPAMSARPMDGDGWVNTGWNNLTGRTLDLDGGTTAADINANFHSFSCSKCHTPHASRLPALMITNCLDTKNNTWDNAFQVHGTTDTINAGRSISNWSSAQNCHRVGGNDPSDTRDTAANAAGGNAGWNTVTPW